MVDCRFIRPCINSLLFMWWKLVAKRVVGGKTFTIAWRIHSSNFLLYLTLVEHI